MDTGIKATSSGAHRSRARGRCWKTTLSGTISDLDEREQPAMKQYTVALRPFLRNQTVCTRMPAARFEALLSLPRVRSWWLRLEGCCHLDDSWGA